MTDKKYNKVDLDQPVESLSSMAETLKDLPGFRTAKPRKKSTTKAEPKKRGRKPGTASAKNTKSPKEAIPKATVRSKFNPGNLTNEQLEIIDKYRLNSLVKGTRPKLECENPIYNEDLATPENVLMVIEMSKMRVPAIDQAKLLRIPFEEYAGTFQTIYLNNYFPNESEKNQVRVLSAMGVPVKFIAFTLNISETVLRREFEHELMQGAMDTYMTATKSFLELIEEKEWKAVEFYLKTTGNHMGGTHHVPTGMQEEKASINITLSGKSLEDIQKEADALTFDMPEDE